MAKKIVVMIISAIIFAVDDPKRNCTGSINLKKIGITLGGLFFRRAYLVARRRQHD